jgi:hypothetical protein
MFYEEDFFLGIRHGRRGSVAFGPHMKSGNYALDQSV